jgi:hypothetical protein
MTARARALAGLAVVVAGALAGGAAYALDQATGDVAGDRSAASPSPSPTVSPTPSGLATPILTVSPTATSTASSSAAPTPTSSPTPSRAPSTAPGAPAKRYPYPAPTTSYAPLALRASIDPQAGAVGQTFTLEGNATDGDGTIFVTSVSWGDGTVDGGEASPASCPAYPSPTAAPGPYRPRPDDRTFTRTHAYSAAGSYKVVLTVRSINADCRPNGPRAEVATVTFDGPSRVSVA